MSICYPASTLLRGFHLSSEFILTGAYAVGTAITLCRQRKKQTWSDDVSYLESPQVKPGSRRGCVYEPTLANPSTVTNGQLQVIFMYSEHVSEGISHEEHRTSAWLKHESSALTLIIQDPLLGKNFLEGIPALGF